VGRKFGSFGDAGRGKRDVHHFGMDDQHFGDGRPEHTHQLFLVKGIR